MLASNSCLCLLVLFLAHSTSAVNYVIPNGFQTCLDDHAPCLTLEEYTEQNERYFTNDTIFLFYPGIHVLNDSLILDNLCNISMQGLYSDDSKATIIMDENSHNFIHIIWNNCQYITISSLAFHLEDIYDYTISFYFSHFVQLSNIYVSGNEVMGCNLIKIKNSTITMVDSTFTGLYGDAGAVMSMTQHSSVSFLGNNIFENNEALLGGAIYSTDSELYLNGTTLFMNNKALKRSALSWWYKALCDEYLPLYRGDGGAIFCNSSFVKISGHTNFINNVVKNSGGAVYGINVKIVVQDYALFTSNSADMNGGAIELKESYFELSGNVHFVKNTAAQGGALDIFQTNAQINILPNQQSNTPLMYLAMFRQNRAARGGSIACVPCNLSLGGVVHFVDNTAYGGGAVILSSTAKVLFMSSLQMSFIRNHANDVGGAIYVFDGRCLLYTSVTDCFFSIGGVDAMAANISLLFVNNSAGFTGSTLYGGRLNECRLWFINTSKLNENQCGTNAYSGYTEKALETFTNISKIQLLEKTLKNISSNAQDIKLCRNNDVINTKDSEIVRVYPGQEISIRLMSAGQAGNGVRAKIVRVYERSLIMNFAHAPYNTWDTDQNDYSSLEFLSPYADSSCSNVSFRLYSILNNGLETFRLYPNCQSSSPGLNLRFEVLPCPLGFMLSIEEKKCICNNILQKVTSDCYIDTFSIRRARNNYWISKANDATFILHDSRCPLDYCKTDPVNVTLGVNHESAQCDFNRIGSLCGQCKANHSLALGSLHCLQCGNHYTVLLLPFVLAGVFLIAMIFLLRMTVAIGTLNGLIFYANVVQANHQAFFPRATINFCTYFISWLNLDLGIETCLYDGMDIYAYSWLQFFFPFYIWFLIGIIIYASRYSKTFANCLGQNPVAVLATVLLLSYSKLLKAIITPLSWTYLTYYNATTEYQRKVWYYDGNVEFMKDPKHIALGAFAILTIALFVFPYILLLLCGHCLQSYSNWLAFKWINKLKPIMDAYHAPYKKQKRYWTGLLLVSRMGLFLTFAINAQGNEGVNILAIASVSAAIFALKGQVYEHWLNDALESISLLNLSILSIATYYIKNEVEKSVEFRSQLILSSISVATAFITFIGILFYHIAFCIKSTSAWKKTIHPIIHKCNLFTKIERRNSMDDGSGHNVHENLNKAPVLPTSTIVDIDLREPLMELRVVHDC